jgi:hypothetical protein
MSYRRKRLMASSQKRKNGLLAPAATGHPLTPTAQERGVPHVPFRNRVLDPCGPVGRADGPGNIETLGGAEEVGDHRDSDPRITLKEPLQQHLVDLSFEGG